MDTCSLLNQLIAIHARSLPVYLVDASLWMANDMSPAKDVLNIIAADNELTVDRLAELVIEKGGSVSQGAYPMEFTGMHDLSMDYLVSRLRRYQRRDIDRIQAIVNQLSSDPVARSAAEEALGAAKGHLESLDELQSSAVAS